MTVDADPDMADDRQKTNNAEAESGEEAEADETTGFTAIFFAALNGNVDLAEKLIGAGCSLNIHDKNNLSPLAIACDEGHSKTAGVLIEARADVDGRLLRDFVIWTPLMLACANGHRECVKLLLASRADVTFELRDVDKGEPATAIAMAKESEAEDAKLIVRAIEDHKTLVETMKSSAEQPWPSRYKDVKEVDPEDGAQTAETTTDVAVALGLKAKEGKKGKAVKGAKQKAETTVQIRSERETLARLFCALIHVRTHGPCARGPLRACQPLGKLWLPPWPCPAKLTARPLLCARRAMNRT